MTAFYLTAPQLLLYTKAVTGINKLSEKEGSHDKTVRSAKEAVLRLQRQGIEDPTPQQVVEEMRNVSR